jgi:RNA polymerase sigma-70 factor, ECF subfamily
MNPPPHAARYASVSDEDLVDAARAGDRAALDALLRRHHDRVYAVCRRLCPNEADARDACQEALVAVARRLDRFDGRSRFATWLYRVTTNACLDELRRARRRPASVDWGLGDDGRAGALDDETDAAVERLALAAALAALPATFRAPVVLRDVAGLDYAAIAEALDLPPGTVRSRIARGRAQLARALSTAGNQEGFE